MDQREEKNQLRALQEGLQAGMDRLGDALQDYREREGENQPQKYFGCQSKSLYQCLPLHGFDFVPVVDHPQGKWDPALQSYLD